MTAKLENQEENGENRRLEVNSTLLAIVGSSINSVLAIQSSRKSMAKGPEHIRINSGELLSVAICDIRSLVSLFEPLAPFALNSYALSFDDVILSLLKKYIFFYLGL